MKSIPVYFPMTYLSAAAESRLSACFPQTVVYRPSDRTLPEAMQSALDADRIKVQTPVAAESDRLAELMKAYYAWAEENKGVDLSVFKGRESRIPFFEDTSISHIRQNIRNMGNAGVKEAAGDPVFRARLFLEMAQELDRQNSELERSLDDVRVKEDSMLADLLGDAGDPGGIKTVFRADSVADPGAYMTGTRLQTWWQLARNEPVPGNLLVTDSPAVIAYLVEKEPGLKKAGEPLRLPFRLSGNQPAAVWQDRLLDYLVQLTSPADAGDLPADIPAVRAGEAT
ncbi:MAG: hypothetical protein GY697_15855, partial [Desulfobacterales bacterium]|nr:hypothetical protein [Desulfobacterales bacterium]